MVASIVSLPVRLIDWSLRDYGVPGQLGLEPTPEEYVANMVAVFREVWRVMRDDGTLWLNLGDSYCGSVQGGGAQKIGSKQATNFGSDQNRMAGRLPPSNKIAGLKAKDLVGIPWRVAFALQADGWYLRSDIIWAKPNPMPESVTDRPTKAHEYVFLLTKQRARYYFDAEAVKESNSPTSGKWGKSVVTKTATAQGDGLHGKTGFMGGEIGHDEVIDRYYTNGRNIRTVWTIPTAPTPFAHFATYPPRLVMPCIKAGTSEKGCCPVCGAGWVRVVEKGYRAPAEEGIIAEMIAKGVPRQKANLYGNPTRNPKLYAANPDKTTGWQPSCNCPPAAPIPCVVFDPFAGSGTTLMVARQCWHGLAIELKRQDGTLSDEQVWWLDKLTEQGYLATACWGAREAISVLAEYMDIEGWEE